MTESNQVNELFETLAKILLRCFGLGYFVLLLWFVMCLCGGEAIYGLAGKPFGLTPHEWDMTNYCGMSMMKGAVVLFFLCPYVAIRLVLRKCA